MHTHTCMLHGDALYGFDRMAVYPPGQVCTHAHTHTHMHVYAHVYAHARTYAYLQTAREQINGAHATHSPTAAKQPSPRGEMAISRPSVGFAPQLAARTAGEAGVLITAHDDGEVRHVCMLCTYACVCVCADHSAR